MVKRGVNVSVGTCIIDQSFEEIELLTRILKDMGVRAHRISSVSEKGNTEKNNIIVSEKKCRFVFNTINKLMEKYNCDTYKIISIEKQRNLVDDNFKNCGFGHNMLKVSPDEKVYPCAISDTVIGKLTNISLKEFLMENSTKDFINIEMPNIRTCRDGNNLEICKGCIEEGLKYNKRIKDCNWFNTNKAILNRNLF